MVPMAPSIIKMRWSKSSLMFIQDDLKMKLQPHIVSTVQVLRRNRDANCSLAGNQKIIALNVGKLKRKFVRLLVLN